MGVVYDLPYNSSIAINLFAGVEYDSLSVTQKEVVDIIENSGLHLGIGKTINNNNASIYFMASQEGVRVAFYYGDNPSRIYFLSTSLSYGLRDDERLMSYYSGADGSYYLGEPRTLYIDLYNNRNEAERALGIGHYPITYRPTNCSFPNAPTEAMIGDTVVVPVRFPDGYGLVNESNIYVTNNGVVIPSTYSNGQLTFTMPDPS